MSSPDVPLENFENRVRNSFDQQSLMQTIKAELVSVEPGRVIIAANVLPGFRQQQGAAHAGLTFTLGDTAAGYAALSLMPDDMEVMTVEMKINLISPGSGRLVAEGRVVKAGRRLTVVAADIWAEQSKGKRRQVAMMQGTMIPVPKG